MKYQVKFQHVLFRYYIVEIEAPSLERATKKVEEQLVSRGLSGENVRECNSSFLKEKIVTQILECKEKED